MVWFVYSAFLCLAYLMVMFYVLRDIFRDTDASGTGKAAWVLALIFLPVLSACIYIALRGDKMRERSVAHRQDLLAQGATPIEPAEFKTGSPADQIAKAQELSDSGAISTAEFDALKAKALN